MCISGIVGQGDVIATEVEVEPTAGRQGWVFFDSGGGENGLKKVRVEKGLNLLTVWVVDSSQQLLPQVKGSKKLLSRCGQAPKEPSPEIFTIRPYRGEDREMVYQTCLETGSSGQDATQLFTNYPNLLGDRCVHVCLCNMLYSDVPTSSLS